MKHFSFNRSELAGSVGDLGLFVPIVAALIVLNGMNATLILLSAGLLYVITGLYFKIPFPVQPLKAVASIAIALSLAPKVTSAAGLWMGVILAVIAITPLANKLGYVFSKPVIRGIQVAIGIFLLKASYELLTKTNFFVTQENTATASANLNVLLFFSVIILILVFRNNFKIPASLAALVFGLIVGIVYGGLKQLYSIEIGPQPLAVAVPSAGDFYTALVVLVIPQLPMTLANSVIATRDVAKKYFGKRAHKVTPRALLTSISAANISFGFFGAMPLCHGAGGMTSHYRFGARTGAILSSAAS